MDYLYIGKLVNTHGIRGEVRIISNFRHKNLVFKKSFKLYIGKEKKEYVIESYRKHKNFDMVVFKDYYDINLVEHLKGSNVYINKEDLDDKLLAVNLIGFSVICNNELVGIVHEIIDNGASEILVLDNNRMIPYVKDFIKNVDISNKKVIINYIKGITD